MVATNIAETSITIDGIIHVIDSCFVKMAWFNSDTYTDSLIITEVYIHRLLSFQRYRQTQAIIITEVYIQTQTLTEVYIHIQTLVIITNTDSLYHYRGMDTDTDSLIITEV